MPIGFGLAGSHSAHMLTSTPEEWYEVHKVSIARRLSTGVPAPPEEAQETLEVIRGLLERRDRSLGTLKDKLAEYQPDLMILVGGDQNQEIFDHSNVPNIMLYIGEEDAWGDSLKRGQKPSEETMIRLKVDSETSRLLLNKLVTQEGFDVAFSSEQRALGSSRGFPHAIMRPIPRLMPRPDLPTVLVLVSSYDFPALSGQRCYDLGRALARLLKNDPRRIAIGASGGLSHDPFGPRAGWVDHVLDRWFIEQITAGNGRCTSLYQFDSMTMRSGTGETRAWIVVAGAMEEMGAHAEVVDYFPSYTAIHGACWAYWPTSNGTARS